MKEETSPFKTMQFSGVTFQVINRDQAHEIIRDLTDFNDEKIYDVFENTWRFPDFQDNPCFLMAEDDVHTDTFLMDYNTEEYPDVFILGFIFKRNLTVQKVISSYDTDNSPALIVIGKITAPNITLFGNVHYIGNGLQCDSLIGNYNHGELFVKGQTSATLVYSDDMPMHFENFITVKALISKQRPEISILYKVSDKEGTNKTLENFMPSSHKLSDIVKDGYIEYSSDYNKDVFNSNYYEDFMAGVSLIDTNKKEQYEYAHFCTQFIKMISFLSNTENVKKDGFLFIEDDNCKYSFQSFTHEEKLYSEINQELVNFDLRMRALFCIDTDEITVVLEYLAEDGNPKYQFYESEKAAGVVFCAVKYAVFETFEILKASLISDNNSENSNTNGHGLNLIDLKKVIDSQIVQNSETDGINFEIGNAEISINKIAIDSDGNETGNSIYVSHPDYTLFFKIIDDSPFVLYLEKETDEFRHIKIDSPIDVVEFYKEIWKKIVNEVEGFDEDIANRLTFEEFITQFGNHEIPADLKKLYEIEHIYGAENLSECFSLNSIDKTGLKSYSDDEAFYNSFIEFASANGSGSTYAYWLIDNDLNKCPIVVFGDEGGVYIVAENTQQLIHLLTLGTEISVDYDEVSFYDLDEDQEPLYRNEYLEWVKRNFDLEPISQKKSIKILTDAKQKYQKQLNEFLAKFSIETDDETEVVVTAKEKSDKYAFQKIEGEKITFKDFNFKLAIIQILMYEKELITPKFDLYEFIDLYDKRDIDIEKEGYDFIPEVTAYFENLEIDLKFAEQITEIIQDGGDDIYGELYRFWDGEDDVFNIKSSDDFVNFKNITKVELFYDEDETLANELRNRGIHVEN
ncbi:hypothetical protein KHA90_00030 [Flavobacterium psychroterrae]|uniref:DUF6892 domain-containing protein n=1 Tax=Flavobacterium psychroterrae TaxID=2133767 RepID=A0ABS5P528_9FLAO|nr:hypothetical protein [Flavobacterium psychroterrae]MBS7229398.1 hypothetical protein [Flavobacterium psychroterrae]